jgi:hypothetical protein
MDVYVQVWNFLESCLANRVPETQAFIWKCPAHRTSDASYHGHQRGARSLIKLTHIVEMLARNHERVAWMELP